MVYEIEADKNGDMPTHYAAKSGNVDILEYLMGKEFINLEPRNYKNQTPLHISAIHGKVEAVKFIMENGIYFMEEKNETISIEPQDMDGKTPLHLSAEYGNLDVFKYLMSHR